MEQFMSKFQQALERVHQKYRERAIVVLKNMQYSAERRGLQTSSIRHDNAEHPVYSLIVHPVEVPQDKIEDWHETDLGVEFHFVDSLEFDGDIRGLAFRIEFEGDGGKTYGVTMPYNYTEHAWVRVTDDHAIEERFKETAQFSVFDFLGCLEEHCKVLGIEYPEVLADTE